MQHPGEIQDAFLPLEVLKEDIFWSARVEVYDNSQYIAVYSHLIQTASSINLAPRAIGGCVPLVARRASVMSRTTAAAAATMVLALSITSRPASAFDLSIFIYPCVMPRWNIFHLIPA